MCISPNFRRPLLALSAVVALSLSGCALSGPFGASSTSKGTAGALATGFGGRVHGGNQPVVGATVTLWAAGAPTVGGGYGTGATVVGTALTLADGSFSFNIAGASPCTTGQHLYMTATGGNTGAGINTYSAMMAAVPAPCSAATASTSVWINEVTTVAAVWSLQQFMTITPNGVVKWQIGAPSTNLTGLTNAFSQTAQLAAVLTGTSAVSTVASLAGGVAYTTTITPDSSRINTLADILAACVNTNGSSICSSLFADATPGSATAPTDTIQVAYYLATNPGGLTMAAHGSANSPTYLCNTYPTAAGSPFQPTLTCGTNTNDWLLGVTWGTNVTGTTACGQSGAVCIGTVDAASLAIDQTGNIWIGAGSGVAAGGAMITEFNQSGQEILAPVGAAVVIPAYSVNFIEASVASSLPYAGTGTSPVALSYGRPTTSIAVDTNNNAWFTSYAATTPGTITNGTVSLPTGTLVEVTPSGTVNGFITSISPGSIAIDGYNNLYMSAEPASSRYYLTEVESGAQSGETGVAFQTIDQGTGRGTGIYNNVFVDVNEIAWSLNSSTTCGTAATPININRSTTASQEAATVSAFGTSTITDNVGCAYQGASDAAGNAWVTASGNLYYLNASTAPAATITTVTGATGATATSVSGVGGLDNSSGVAIDGVGNVWTINRVASNVASGISEFSTTTTGTTTTTTALSPGSAAGVFGFNDFGAVYAQGVVIDSSGNLWLETTGNSALWHLVGAAAPVVTPMALAVKNGTVAARP